MIPIPAELLSRLMDYLELSLESEPDDPYDVSGLLIGLAQAEQQVIQQRTTAFGGVTETPT